MRSDMCGESGTVRDWADQRLNLIEQKTANCDMRATD